jgi:RNA polymerase-binding transcription factor
MRLLDWSVPMATNLSVLNGRPDREDTASTTTSERYADLKEMLESRRREIEMNIRGRMAAVREEYATVDRRHSAEDGEVSDVDLQEEIEITLVQLQRETLDRIRAALQRLEQGLYGRCTECGEDIPAARLRAVPFAVRCVECEDAREADAKRHHRMGANHAVWVSPSQLT